MPSEKPTSLHCPFFGRVLQGGLRRHLLLFVVSYMYHTYIVPQRYKRSAKPLARSSTMTCANQMMSSLFWYKDGGHIIHH